MVTKYSYVDTGKFIYLVEWDVKKDKTNAKKHGLDFEEAKFVLLDENRLDYFDESHSQDELRYITIGSIGAIIFVVYTERHESFRIISARFATDEEQEEYYDHLQNLDSFR